MEMFHAETELLQLPVEKASHLKPHETGRPGPPENKRENLKCLI